MRKTAKGRGTDRRTAGNRMGMRDDREAEGPRGTVGEEMAPEGKKKGLTRCEGPKRQRHEEIRGPEDGSG